MPQKPAMFMYLTGVEKGPAECQADVLLRGTPKFQIKLRQVLVLVKAVFIQS